MRGLDLESDDTLLTMLTCRLSTLSHRLTALVSESDASPELGDDIAAVVSDLDRCEAAVEVLRSRVPTRNRNGNGGTSNDNCE